MSSSVNFIEQYTTISYISTIYCKKFDIFIWIKEKKTIDFLSIIKKVLVGERFSLGYPVGWLTSCEWNCWDLNFL